MNRDDMKCWIPRFSPDNLELLCLASRAAIEIDNYMRNQNSEDESVKYLSKLLDDITQGEDPKKNLISGWSVLGYAIPGREKAKEYWKDKHFPDNVVLQINLVAKDLRDFKSLPEAKQEGLIEFCCNLFNEIRSYRHQCGYSHYGLVA